MGEPLPEHEPELEPELEPDVEPLLEAAVAWAARPRRPFAPPLRSLLCTEDLVSVKLLRSPPGVLPAAARPRFPRPFGVRASKSLVGESQNLQHNPHL